MNVDCEESNGIAKMNAKTKKSIVLVNLMKDYKRVEINKLQLLRTLHEKNNNNDNNNNKQITH